MKNANKIYFDHSATTPVDREVLKQMLPYFSDTFGNASSVHGFGRSAVSAVDAARCKVAEILDVSPKEIYFTSGGTEAANWAIKGVKLTEKRNRIMVSAIEHSAVLAAAKQVKKDGAELILLPVTSEGFVQPSSLETLINEQTALVSVMLANNEIGTIQPVKELAKIAHKAGAYFYTDAVQAVGSIVVKPRELGVDMLSLSAHKFYGPKGIGVLYIRAGTHVDKLICGGHQERTMRGGTTNVPLIVGLAAALEKAAENQQDNLGKVSKLRDYFVRGVEKNIPYVIFNGSMKNRLPQNANFSFDFIEGEALLLLLDHAGIACSTGSACSNESLEPSHVLLAMGKSSEKAHGSLRFSFGIHNTKKEIDIAVKVLAEAVAKLRSYSPLYHEFCKEVNHVHG
ncbi:MAG: cysteine desulfurase [Firmicutes bacterium]|nr:cysteine desulfurase [Bacillota bacterium]